MFRPRDVASASPLAILRLTWGGGEVPDALGTLGPASSSAIESPAGLKRAAVERRLRFEENVLRAALTEREAGEDGTVWYWKELTPRPSSHLDVDLGHLADREGGKNLTFEVKVRLLGWSRPETPKGVSQHHVDVFLNGRKIGESEFNGRRPEVVDFANLPVAMLRDGANRLRLKIPQRELSGEAEPLVDLVYVDWIEVRYRPSSPLADGTASLELGASKTPRWLPDPKGTPGSRLLAVEGWTAKRSRSAGWVLPSGPASEIWIVDDSEVRAPLALERLSR
ncbi:MAG TPA: hypothetical protein VKA53_05525, partial [Thermoanaerobaculia bacterium]|nr:hypothetical protein [Thermoanaerobaculia bacterium]